MTMTLAITAVRHTCDEECDERAFSVFGSVCLLYDQARYGAVLRRERGKIDYAMLLIYSDMSREKGCNILERAVLISLERWRDEQEEL